MKHVTILGLTDTSATIIAGPLDIFHFAGRLWNHIFGEPQAPYFRVKIASSDGNPIRCLGGITIQAHQCIAEIHQTDLLIIPSIKDINETMANENAVIPWIQRLHDKGAHVAAICTGTFVLAETGLLDGKIATTHWGAADQFRRRYPRVKLKPERLITESDTIFTSGGSNACFDISLYLVRRYCGQDVTRKLAKTFLHDLDRVSQAPWAVFQCQQNHSDKAIRCAQEQFEHHYRRQFNIDHLARELGMSRRTFERRFRTVTGDSPLHYLHRVRVEAAKRILETENRSFEEIVHAVGYEDASFFRKIFTQMTGLSPITYRRKWNIPMEFTG
jgi:transcriptional regulator GlxA family with amidase domain